MIIVTIQKIPDGAKTYVPITESVVKLAERYKRKDKNRHIDVKDDENV